MRHRAAYRLSEGQAVSRSTGGMRHLDIRGHHQDHHQQVQSQDHHQAVRTPPGTRHGWRSGIGATTGHRRATGPPIEAEAVTRSTRTRPGGIALWSRFPPYPDPSNRLLDSILIAERHNAWPFALCD